jgi:tetratricopeptide (TPR) repeat protein
VKKAPGTILLLLIIVLIIAVSPGCQKKGSPGPSSSKSPGSTDSRDSPADKYLDLAQERYINKDFPNAVVQGELALNACSSSPNPQEAEVKVRRFLSYAYAKTKDYAKAEEMLKKLLERDPKNEDYRKSLKEIRSDLMVSRRARAQKKLAEAERNYKDERYLECVDCADEARMLFKDNKGTPAQIASALALKGKGLMKAQSYEEAAQCLKDAIKLDPSDSRFRSLLAEAERGRQKQVGVKPAEPFGSNPPGIPGGSPTTIVAPPSSSATPGEPGTIGENPYSLTKVGDGVYALSNSKNGRGFALRILGPRHYQFFDQATNMPLTTKELGSDTYEVSDTKKGYRWKIRITPDGQIEFEELM